MLSHRPHTTWHGRGVAVRGHVQLYWQKVGWFSWKMVTGLMLKALASQTTLFHHQISIVQAQHESMVKGLFFI